MEEMKWPKYEGKVQKAEKMYPTFPITPSLPVPDSIPRPDYTNYKQGRPTISDPKPPHLKTGVEVMQMRRACSIASYIREFAGKQVRPGISLDEIDAITHHEIVRLGVYPSPLGYYDFPKCIATSVNNVLCHGIPDTRVLKEGDVINCDISIFADGYHGDCSGTFIAGEGDEKAHRLIQATHDAMTAGIGACADGQMYNRIGQSIQEIAHKYGFAINPTFCGHGIGRLFHENPTIYHYANNYPGVMKEGMTFTVEPILVESKYAQWVKGTDGWAILSADGARSAQWEETILVRKDSPEILTEHKIGYYDLKQ
jgi:methionyl aminopeptidase